jgi:hypothetical protein
MTRRTAAAALAVAAAACCVRGAAASFACCTAAACAASPPSVCCAGLYDATKNDAAQCGALAALYASAGGAGWHLSSDWNASKAGNYGGAHAEGAHIVVRAENAPAVVGDIFNMLIPSGANLEPPGHGYDYYDFFKYDYALEFKRTDASYTYHYDDDGNWLGMDTTLTVTPFWPNAALFRASFDMQAHARTGGWEAAAGGTPTDFCTFYGVFCSSDGDVAILCVRACVCTCLHACLCAHVDAHVGARA